MMSIIKIILCARYEILIFISAIFHVGVAGIVESFLGAFAFSEGASNYFEVHELTFAIGLCIIYYLFFAERKKHNTGKLVFLVISFILGSKRIGMAGIAAAGLFSLFVHKKGLSRRKLLTIGIVGVLVCYGYLFIVYNNEFFAILNEHGINNMGRDLIYAYFVRRTKLSPTQMGWGMAGVAKVLYASRCNNFHGNVAARMNSINANKDTFKMYTDMFLTEYIILAIHLNSQGALSDMVLNKVKENANLMVM